MSSLRVVFLDDLLMVAEATAYRISSLPGIEVVGCYRVNEIQSADEAAELAPDVVVVNLNQVVESIADLLERIATLMPSARVIALISSGGRAFSPDELRSPVSAWIQNDDSHRVLIATLHSIRRIQGRSAPSAGPALSAVTDDPGDGEP